MSQKVLICAFPGVGKTTFFNRYPDGYKKFRITDSDSSKFDKKDFPQNYIKHIKELLADDEDRIILVSSHEEVRESLEEENIKYILLCPHYGAYSEYIGRYRHRGSPENFITLMKISLMISLIPALKIKFNFA